ncbi:MAG: MFS transporter [Candidatus Magasanikbacteria bacterium]
MHLNRPIKLLLYGANIWFLGEGMLGPLFAIFTEKMGGDIFDITWAWATYLIVSGIFYIIVGKFADGKKNTEKIMVCGYALNALFTFAYLFVSSPWHLFFVQAGLGIAAALATPTWDALYARYEDKQHDTFEWGLAEGGAKIVTGVAVVMGGLIVAYFSFSTLFIIMGIIQLVATIYQAQILKTS